MSAEKQHLEYLDRLRASGRTNMFGATPYLEGEFGMTREEARAVLLEWMNSFADRQQRGEVQS